MICAAARLEFRRDRKEPMYSALNTIRAKLLELGPLPPNPFSPYEECLGMGWLINEIEDGIIAEHAAPSEAHREYVRQCALDLAASAARLALALDSTQQPTTSNSSSPATAPAPAPTPTQEKNNAR